MPASTATPDKRRRTQQIGWWLIPAVLAILSGVSARLVYVEGIDAELDVLDAEARLAGDLVLQRIEFAESQMQSVTRDLERRISSIKSQGAKKGSDQIEAFYDHAEVYLPRSIAAALFWFPKEVGASGDADSSASFPMRARAGSQNIKLPTGIDLGKVAQTRTILARALTSNAGIATLMPSNDASAPKDSVLILTAVLSRQEADRDIPIDNRLQGFLGARVGLTQFIPTLGEGRMLRVYSPSPGADPASAELIAGTAAVDTESLWSRRPGLIVTQGLNWHVAVGRDKSSILSPQHFGAVMTLTGGLVTSLALLMFLRARQKQSNLDQAAARRAESDLRTETSMSELATTARGLGVFRLDLEGTLIEADANALAILGQDGAALNTLGLRHWWLGLGDQSPGEALAGLQVASTVKGFTNTLASLPDHSTKEIGLSVTRIKTGGEEFWVGVIEDLSARPWTDLDNAAVMDAFESASSELSIWSNDLRCLKFNRAFGLAHRPLATGLDNARLPELMGPTIAQLAQLALQGEPKSARLERQVPGRDSALMFEHQFEVLRPQGGSTQALLLITSTDISEVNKERTDLAARVRSYEDLMSSSTLAIFHVDKEGQFLYRNPAAANLLGWAHMASAPTAVQQMLPANDQAVTDSPWRRLQQGVTINGLETQLQHADGSTKHVRLFGTAYSTQTSGVAYCLIAEDLTEQIAQARKREGTAEVALLVLDSHPQAIAIFDARDQLYYFNQAFAGLYQTSSGCLKDKVTFEAFLTFGLRAGQYDTKGQRHQDWLQERLAAHAKPYSLQTVRLDDDNWAEQIEFRLENGFTVLIGHDVTTEQQALEQSKKSSEAKSAFLASMSHEIRTPLNGILGMAQVLTTPNLDEGKRLDYAQTIQDSGHVLLHLLNQALDLSKIEAGKVEVHLTPTNPAELCRAAAELFASNAELKGLTLSHAWSGPEARYELDQTRLSQMLFNLVGNAIKFTQTGGVRIEAQELRRAGAAAELEFAVIDTGPGVTQAQREVLFQPFSQLENAANSNTGSAGLGLSIVRAMAELMGGYADVESDSGGARFFFTVSATLASTQPETASPALETAIDTQPLARGMRIMLMEDNPVMRTLLERMLSSLGAEVIAFDNGQDGMDAVAAGDGAQVILLDLEMPGLGGLVVAEMIRSQETQSGLNPRLIAAVTAAASPTDHEACKRAGIDAVLMKPVTLTDLSDFLARHIERQQTPADAKPLNPKQRAQLNRVWDQLQSQLKAQQYYATNTFSRLVDLLEGRGFNKPLVKAQGELNNYDFEKVLQTLGEMMASISAEDS